MNNHHHIERHTKLRRVTKIGQYYLIIDLDKKEFLYSHKFGNGLKLLEFGCSPNGMMTGLAILLASGNNRGGGDLHSYDPIIGSWAGDRIVIAGDYDDPEKFVKEIGVETFGITRNDNGHEYKENLYGWIQKNGEDISEKVLKAMCEDEYVKGDLIEKAKMEYEGSPMRKALENIGIDWKK